MGCPWTCCSSLTAAVPMAVAVVAVAVVTFDLAVYMDVDDIETMSGRQRLVEVEGAGCTMAGSILARVNLGHRLVYLRPAEDMKWMSQLKWKERLWSVGQD